MGIYSCHEDVREGDNGETTDDAKFTFSGNVNGELNGSPEGFSRVKLLVQIVDVTDSPDVVDEKTIFDEQADFGTITVDENINDTVYGIPLEKDHHYNLRYYLWSYSECIPGLYPTDTSFYGIDEGLDNGDIDIDWYNN